MAIHTGLIPAMEIDNIHDITVITDSIAAARKILESKVDPLQNILIPLATAVKTFLSKDGRNKIHFWYCPSRAEWPRHKLVDDQVKASSCAPTFPSKESHLFSKKKECDNTLCEWQTYFANSLKKGHYFLNFEDEKGRVIKPTYTKGAHGSPLENTDRDSSPTSPPAALAAKPKSKLKNTSSGSVIGITPPSDHATSSSIALSTFLQITPKHLALTTDKVPSRCSSPEQKRSLHHVAFSSLSPLLLSFIYLSTLYSLSLYLSRYCVLTMACLRTPCNKPMIFFKKKKNNKTHTPCRLPFLSITLCR